MKAKTLSNYLQKHFNKKVIILVDEYDAPIINAFNNTNSPIKSVDKERKTYYENIINFMQGFLGDAFKGNNDLKKGLLTGVMRVGNGMTAINLVTPHKFIIHGLL